MKFTQRALGFSCQGSRLVGIVDVPERPLSRGVLVLTSGQQYRVGGHRQFTLMARMLAPRGIAVMRFDCRGAGDSEGTARSVDQIDADLHAAMKEFFLQIPEMTEIVIWALDGAATAAGLFAHTDPQISGLVLLNPWMREPDTSRTSLFPHLRARFGELGFWRKIAGATSGAGTGAGAGTDNTTAAAMGEHVRADLRAIALDSALPLQQRVIASLSCFTGHTLVVLGGADPLAHEFAELLDKHDTRCRRVMIAGANHSFASREWRDEVAETSANWIMSW